MNNTIVRAAQLSVIFGFSLFFLACDLFFKNPPQGEAADPAPFLGTWTVAEYLAQPPVTPMTARISLEPNGFVGIRGGPEGEESILHVGKLLNVGGLVVLALQQETGNWLLLNLVLDGNSSRLDLRVPNFPALRDAVAGGGLPGETYVIDRDDQLTIITAESETLTQYIAAHPGFFNGAYAILERE